MSDPSQIHLPIHTALTSDMMLGLKPSAPKSRSYRLSVAPINKSIFAPGDQMIFELPTGRRGVWLDQKSTYIKFTVQCTTTTACTQTIANNGNGVSIDNTAYSFIQRLDVYNSSNLLETINEYGQLANLLIDTSLTQSDKAGLSALIGSNPYNNSITAGGTYAQYASNTQLRVAGDRSGLSLKTDTTMATTFPYNFCLPIMSGVVGVNASKMIPLGKLSAPIRLEFYLSANDDAVYSGLAGVGAAWQLTNVEICACYVEIQDDSFGHFGNEVDYISTTTYRQASTYLPAATSGEFTTLLPFRAASITGLYARFLPFVSSIQGVEASAAYRKGCSINPNFGSYYFRVGSSIYPNKPVYLKATNQGSGAEGYAELLKSFHALSSSIGNSAITFNQYNVAATATAVMAWTIPIGTTNAGACTTQLQSAGTSNNAFAIGLECESFSNRSDTILSGISTLNSQIYFTGNVYNGETVGGANAFNYTAHFFSAMDMILVIDESGVMSAKF